MTEDELRQTVFLPKTEFPMRGNLPQKEPEILKLWQEMDLYVALRQAGKGKKKYILHDGPPYANGNIHMGHAVNKILKDVIVKSWSMMGYDAPYVPGWDCHGLPIEWKIEEKYREAGKNKDDVPMLEFREECRQFASEWKDIQSAQFQRLGVTGNWKTPYLTMTNKAEAAIAREIHKFALNGGLYKGPKPVMWSIVEKTALAEAEVEYHEHKSITVWVKFPVVKSAVALLEGASVVIWTTTPWTLPSNRMISFGTEIEYGVYTFDGQKLAIATKLADSVKQAAKIENWECIGTFKGSELQGTVCVHPLSKADLYYDYKVPLHEGDFVTDDAGTGFVHAAPSHGEDDFDLFIKHYSIKDVPDNITDDGKFRPHVALFAGLEIYTQKGELGQGNFAVLKALQEAGNLLAKGSIRHDYPHSWRSKAPLIYRTTPQWFIAMDNEIKLREVALKSIKETKWHPAKGETRITAMIENRPDWCISRQRAWGVPIALFLHKESAEVLIDKDVCDRIFEVFEKEGADAWWSRKPQDFLGSKYKSEDYTQVFDIVDVWFESGSTHAFCLGDKETWPEFAGVEMADLYLEGSDQHRGWFHSSLLESCGTNGRAPYKNVLTHGFALDEKGYKMSKSLGNVIDPLKVMEEHGADIIRLWVMLSDYSEDIRIGKDTLKNTADLYRRIRNTLRFLLGALDGFTADERVDLSDKNVPELERLMLHHLYVMDQNVRDCIEKYEYGKVAKMLHDFCNQELSAFYFDIRKDRLYCDRLDLFERRACRTVMAEIFNCLTAWLAPILSFTAEEAWQYCPAGVFDEAKSVHLRGFIDVPKAWELSEKNYQEKWAKILGIRSTVLTLLEPKRQDKTIGSSLEAAPLLQFSDKDFFEAISRVDMAEICITSAVNVKFDSQNQIFEFQKASGHKCARCWKVLPEVKEDTGLCVRCADAVTYIKDQTKGA